MATRPLFKRELSRLLLVSKMFVYYMAVAHKDWELPHSRIWLVEIDIESGLDFAISTDLVVTVVLKKLQTKNMKKLACSC